MSGGQIELVSLSKRFVELAVDDVNLTVSSGEFVSLLGPSGCGKTTTLRLIAGFEQPTAGKVLLDGADVTNTPANKRKVNTVFQSYALFPHLDVAKNVAFGLKYKKLDKSERAKRVAAALELVNLTEFADRKSDQLSGGQQQRVAIARALVNDPFVLLADEPTGNLDERATRGIFQLLRDINASGTAVIMATHDLDVVRQAPCRTIELQDGAVVYDSAMDAVPEEEAS